MYAYFGLILICSLAYLACYRYDDTSFVFGQDIVIKQLRARHDEITADIASLTVKNTAADQARTPLRKIRIALAEKTGRVDILIPGETGLPRFSFTTDEYELVVEERKSTLPSRTSGPPNALLSIYGYPPVANDKQRRVEYQIPTNSTEIPHDFDEYRRIIDNLIDDHEKSFAESRDSINKLRAELQSIDDSRRSSNAWGWLDFAYFSVMAQTTVGFGDIVPNSRFVRVLVMAQCLAGLLIVSFIVTIIVSVGSVDESAPKIENSNTSPSVTSPLFRMVNRPISKLRVRRSLAYRRKKILR